MTHILRLGALATGCVLLAIVGVLLVWLGGRGRG